MDQRLAIFVFGNYAALRPAIPVTRATLILLRAGRITAPEYALVRWPSWSKRRARPSLVTLARRILNAACKGGYAHAAFEQTDREPVYGISARGKRELRWKRFMEAA